MSFFITNTLKKSSDSCEGNLPKKNEAIEGLWVCSEDFKKILNFSNSFEVDLFNHMQNSTTQRARKFKRSKVLLLEKNMNIELQKDTAKKFSSQLIKFMQQIKK